MDNWQVDTRGGFRQFNEKSRAAGGNIVNPLQHSDSGSVAYQPEAVENLDSRPSNPPLLHATSSTIVSRQQTKLCDAPLLPAPVFDEYLFPTGNVTHGFNNNTSQDLQGNNSLTMDGSIDSSGHLAMLGQVWGTDDRMCDTSYFNSQYAQPGVNNNDIPEYSSKYISPALLSPGQPSEEPVAPIDEHSPDENNRKLRQPAWGGSRSSHNSTIDSTAPDTITRDNAASSSVMIRRYSAPSTQHAGGGSPQTPTDDTKPKDLRASHNMIEKQYRNRLNDQFETLLRTLPPSTTTYGGDSGHRDNSLSKRKVSKAEVLVMATQYIQDLEKEGRRLKGDNEQLKLKKEELENACVRLGGTRMPRFSKSTTHHNISTSRSEEHNP